MTDTYHSAQPHNPWDRMPSESDKAYRDFECYLDMPYWQRIDLYAYRKYVGNPEASHVSATWLAWNEEYFWEERARAYDNNIQRERREQTIKAQVEAGYELGDELARMEQRMFHVQELLYEKLREKLEEDDHSEWRPMDVINLSRVMSEGFTAITKARSSEKKDPYIESTNDWTDEERELFYAKVPPKQWSTELARRNLTQDADSENHNGL